MSSLRRNDDASRSGADAQDLLLTSCALALALLALSLPLAAAAEGEAPSADRIAIEGFYAGELWRQASGGIATGERYLDSLELTIDVNLDPFGPFTRRAFANVLYSNGREINALSGSAQGVSGIEAVSAVRLYELWFEQSFGAHDGSLRFGLYDVNSEFDSLETASLFLHPSHGMGAEFAQSGLNGPSTSPVTGLALRFQTARGPWAWRAAVVDGVPGDPDHPDRSVVRLSSSEGALLINEVAYSAASGARLAAGYWRYTADFEALSSSERGEPETRDDNAGAYVFAESPVLFGSERGLRLFLRFGETEAHINPIERYLGAGAVYSGFLPERFDAQLGLAMAIAELGEPGRRLLIEEGVSAESREYNYELTFRIALEKVLTLQADLQHIEHPGMNPTIDSGWIVGLRFEVSHRWVK